MVAVQSEGEVVFQSSSSQKAGCNVNPLNGRELLQVFQSSSSQKAGCNSCI